MIIETPYSLKEPFLSNPLSKPFIEFTNTLYQLPAELFPRSPLATANLLICGNDSTGALWIRRLNTAKVIKLGDFHNIQRYEVPVLKLAQIRTVIAGKLTFDQLSQLLRIDLAGSDFENIVGNPLPKWANSVSKMKLVDSDEAEYWWIDEEALLKKTPNYPYKQ